MLESAGGGGNDLSPVTVYEPTALSTHVNIAAGVLGLVLIAHYNVSGVTVSLPSMSVGDIINVKNLNLTDAGDESIELLAYNTTGTPEALFDGRWESIELRASPNANNAAPDTQTNQCARILRHSIYAAPFNIELYVRTNDSY